MKHFRQYIVPTSEDEAVGIRKAVGAKGLFIAGGTTVVPKAARTVDVLIDVTHLGLHGIGSDGQWIEIGATTRLADLLCPEIQSSVPMLHEAASQCATPLIRNMATVGGCLLTVFLPSDLTLALLALDAHVEILSHQGPHRLRLADLLRDRWLDPEWLVRKILVRRKEEDEKSAFLKFGRSSVDVALVNVAVSLKLNNEKIKSLRIAIGQTSSLPMLQELTSEVSGERLTSSFIDRISSGTCERFQPRSDFRASGGYRKQLVKVLVARALWRVVES